jgi:hypothetical protein
LSLSASCFILDAGCTRYATGDGSVYTRVVDKEAKLFHLESRSRAQRKRILRQELAALQGAIEQLQQVSQQRQLRENERKLRFQQLQQQQLQQQLHQQQYAMAAQAQHQQYLMKLIDQQRQQQLPQPQAGLPAGVVPPQKRAPAKPKAVKIAASVVSYAFLGQRLYLLFTVERLVFLLVFLIRRRRVRVGKARKAAQLRRLRGQPPNLAPSRRPLSSTVRRPPSRAAAARWGLPKLSLSRW